MSDQLPESIVHCNEVGLEAHDHLARHRPLGSGDEPYPVRRQSRTQEGDLDHQGLCDAQGVRRVLQDLSSREHFRTGYVEPGALGDLEVEAPHQRGDDVVDSDGLGAGLEPAGQDHDRQACREITYDQPAQAAVTYDHARA